MATAADGTAAVNGGTQRQSPGRSHAFPQAEEFVANRTIMDGFNATHYSAPKVGFGTGSRPPMHAENNAPGPGTYPCPTTLGPSPSSSIRSPPQYSLRSRHLFGSPNMKALSKSSSQEPGPGAYVSKKFPRGRDGPRYSFPKGTRPSDKAKMEPGPGAYSVPAALGSQVLSTRRSYKAAPFGNGERPPLDGTPATEVGPGEYRATADACSTQIDSRKSTAARIKFGSATRSSGDTRFEEPEPGPGDYKIPGGLGTGGAGQPFRSSPAARLSGRTKFGSPFGW